MASVGVLHRFVGIVSLHRLWLWVRLYLNWLSLVRCGLSHFDCLSVGVSGIPALPLFGLHGLGVSHRHLGFDGSHRYG